MQVYCDMANEWSAFEAGWTTILQRGKFKVQQESFDLSMDEYGAGFGSSCGDQFIGN